MKNKLFYIAVLLTLLCCSKHPGEVRLRGKFAHLEQGEFYIYSVDRELGRLDTIHIREGKFLYTLPLEGRCILQLMYPNYSQLAIFAQGGDDIKITGDAQSLNEVKVSGSKDNERYTSFRKETATLPSAEIKNTARQYIYENPDLTLSRYLFTTYFLLNDSATHTEVNEVYDSLCRACPKDVPLASLAAQTRSHGLLIEGGPLPDFNLAMRQSAFLGDNRKEEPDTLSNEDFRGDYLLISFWAGWRSGSQSALYRTRRARREMKAKGLTLNAISYSLDASMYSLQRIEKRDSVDYHSYCDFRCFDSPLAKRWGITRLPYFILVGPDMNIIAKGDDWQKDIDPKYSKLCL